MIRMHAAALAALLLACLAPPASAEWSQDLYGGLALTDSEEWETQPQLIEDGNGGFLAAWIDMRNGNPAIYAQKIDAGGTILWQPEDGILIHQMEYSHYNTLEMTADGSGGALIAFVSKPDDTYWKVMVTHVDAEGSVDWNEPVDVAPGILDYINRNIPQIVPDGSGGAIVAYLDDRGNPNIVGAQRISGAGDLLWGAGGIDVSSPSADASGIALVGDTAGGAYVAWSDDRFGSSDRDLFMQHLTPAGAFALGAAGEPLCSAYDNQQSVQGVPDGFGGALWCWSDFQDGNWDIYAQRTNPDGLTWWSSYGVFASSDTTVQENPVITADGHGGAYIAWFDHRVDSWEGYDVYAQHISASGSRLWSDTGMSVSAREGIHGFYGIDMVPDGLGGVILVWPGYENMSSSAVDLFGQRLDSNGYPQWTTYGGKAVFLGSGDQLYARAAPGPYGGAATIFTDLKNLTSGDISMMFTDHHGYPGFPNPNITDVADFPGDQGGVLMVDWERSYLDEPVNFGIRDYTLWKRLPAAKRALDESQDLRTVVAASKLEEAAVTDMMREGWSHVTTVAAATHQMYSFDAPSYGDSTDVGTVWTEYMVTARQSDTVFWSSLPHGGYSVDNLAPGAPTALAALADGADVDLNWSASGDHDEDLSHYLIYRGDAPGFEIGPATFLATATDTVFVDVSPGVDRWYYRVTAVDVHGNEGLESNEAQAEITVGVDDRLPARFALHDNRPNPFNPSTSIVFELPEAGRVTLKVYDAAGRRVATLLNETREAGEHDVAWRGVDDAGRPVVSGVYFAELTFGEKVATRRMVLLK